MLKIDTETALNLSIFFIESYLRHDMSWGKTHIDDRTLFIGPRTGQILNGGTAIINAWMPEHTVPEFSVTGMSASAILVNASACEVVLNYTVTYHKQDGSSLVHPQILQISWFMKSAANLTPEQKKEHANYKVAVFHISNPEELDERDLVYNTFGDIATATMAVSPADNPDEQWIIIDGVNAVLSRYPSGSIIWVESTNGGHKSLVHTRDQDLRCVNKVGWFKEQYPKLFLQPSVSFVVNPLYIKEVKKFQIELWNGKVLRVPEKKFYKFREEFQEFFGKGTAK